MNFENYIELNDYVFDIILNKYSFIYAILLMIEYIFPTVGFILNTYIIFYLYYKANPFYNDRKDGSKANIIFLSLFSISIVFEIYLIYKLFTNNGIINNEIKIFNTSKQALDGTVV